MIETVQNPIQGVGPPKTSADGPAARKPSVTAAPTQTAEDAVELSAAGQRRLDPSEGGTVRTELVERVKQEIADGTYLTDQKLNTALDRMIQRVFG